MEELRHRKEEPQHCWQGRPRAQNSAAPEQEQGHLPQTETLQSCSSDKCELELESMAAVSKF